MKPEEIIDLKALEKVLKSLADLTKVSLSFCDMKGNIIIGPVNQSNICEKAQEYPDLDRICRYCRKIGGYEACLQRKTYAFKCHLGRLNYAVPFSCCEYNFGFILITYKVSHGNNEVAEKIGEMSDLDRFCDLKELIESSENSDIRFDLNVIKLLEAVCNFTISCIHELPEICKTQKPKDGDLHDIHLPLSSTGIESKISNTMQEKVSILFPAFDYIAVHFREKISIQSLADLCHISPSYFSRLFAKETRASFPQYIIKLRVAYSKQLLSTTDMSIADIAYESGFGDSSHFIKSFKKEENTTPLHYRQSIIAKEYNND